MNNKTKKVLIVSFSLLAILSIFFMLVLDSKEKNNTEEDNINENEINIIDDSYAIGDREMPDADSVTGEITKNIVIEQKFFNTCEKIKKIAIVFAKDYTLEEDDECELIIELLDGDISLAKDTYDVRKDIPSQHRTYLEPKKELKGYEGKELTLRIYGDSKTDSGLNLMFDSTYQNSEFSFDGNDIRGSICFSVTSK